MPTPRAPQLRTRAVTLVELVIFVVVVGAALAARAERVRRVHARPSADPAAAPPGAGDRRVAARGGAADALHLLRRRRRQRRHRHRHRPAAPAPPTAMGPEAGESRLRAARRSTTSTTTTGYAMSGIVDLTNTAVRRPRPPTARSVERRRGGARHPSAPASGDALRITVTVTGPDGGTPSPSTATGAGMRPNASF
ncbi:MAG: hypothetical protein MZW92_58005 [Comamonadaceae bacterium]|nr:hypothetical protein [Comamonadaceae bacterium]